VTICSWQGSAPTRSSRRKNRAGRRASGLAKRADWSGSAGQSESTFHQLSPYIGKTKSSMATSLIAQFTKRGETVYDPFSGCGTFVLEAWLGGRHVVANDLSPYANLLTRAKLYPYRSLQQAQSDLTALSRIVNRKRPQPDLRRVPQWVREFFHPDTLRELLTWVVVLKDRERWFLLACLMGILHHQRPGFLSYPSSHTVPYLRLKKFPPKQFPELYEYRAVFDRLEKKVTRAFKRVATLDFAISRRCFARPADVLRLRTRVDAIITSPPYMRQLDYGRDNRLRLWFLGCNDWQSLDSFVSPGEDDFLDLMERCFGQWQHVLKPNGYCVLVVGDTCRRSSDNSGLPEDVAHIAAEHGDYELIMKHSDDIPNERRVRRGLTGSSSETVLVFRRARA
jgi:hypothetical protein